ncbi:MAG TPA: ABC transporter substrate-binding protein [Acidimicrobiia bacterium]|nr:ABC transporter substrate-binding protein [Acidimicrobiia bacterium]
MPRNRHLTLLLVVAVACGGSAAPTTTTTEPTTTTSTTSTTLPPTTTSAPTTTTTEPIIPNPYGGEAIIGVEIEPDILNPFLPGGSAHAVSRIGRTFWTGALRLDGTTTELEPDVLVEIPTIENGGLSIEPDGTMRVRYRIKEDRVWADGTPITGEDFLFTYQTITNRSYLLDTTIYEDIIPDSIVADGKTFEFSMERPTLAVRLIFNILIPSHAVRGRDFLRAYDNVGWMSGGPFVFEEWVKGSHISVVRNDNYMEFDPITGQQLPYLDRVEFRFFSSRAALVDAFLAREIDVASFADDVGQIERLLAVEDAGVSVDVIGSGDWEQINFQFGENRFDRNPNSYNEHVEYRMAVAHAIDRQRLVDEIFGGVVGPLDSYVDAYLPWLSQGAWAQYDYDPDKAEALLEALCAKPGVDCGARPVRAVLTVPRGADRQRIAQLVAVMLGAVGIRTDIRVEESSVFFADTLDFGIYDMGAWGWQGGPLLTSLLAFQDTFDPARPPSPGGLNFYRWGTPEVDFVDGSPLDGTPYEQAESSVINNGTVRYGFVIRGLHSTADLDDISFLIREAESILAGQTAFLPLYQQPRVGAVWADELGGYVVVPVLRGSPVTVDTWNAAFWFRSDL